MEGREYLEAISVHWSVILKRDLRNIGCKGVDWIEMTQDKLQIWICLNMVMNLGFHKSW